MIAVKEFGLDRFSAKILHLNNLRNRRNRRLKTTVGMPRSDRSCRYGVLR